MALASLGHTLIQALDLSVILLKWDQLDGKRNRKKYCSECVWFCYFLEVHILDKHFINNHSNIDSLWFYDLILVGCLHVVTEVSLENILLKKNGSVWFSMIIIVTFFDMKLDIHKNIESWLIKSSIKEKLQNNPCIPSKRK